MIVKGIQALINKSA